MSVHGINAWFELKGRHGWRQNGGAFQERVWEGPTSILSQFLSNVLPQGYSDISFEGDNDLSTIRAVYNAPTIDQIANPSGDGLIERHWELDGDDLERTLWAHPKILAATVGDTPAESAQLRAIVDAILSGEQAQLPGAGTEDLDQLIAHLAKGIEAFEESKYVLRKVETVIKNTSLRPTFTNIKRVFTYTALIASEPSLLSENIIQASGLIGMEWLKGTPRVVPTQDGLWQITQEYKGAEQWDRWIYPTAT